MNGLNEAIRKLLDGHLVTFIKEDGSQQPFKVINGVLNELKNGDWKERVYLPRWDDLQTGKWVY